MKAKRREELTRKREQASKAAEQGSAVKAKVNAKTNAATSTATNTAQSVPQPLAPDNAVPFFRFFFREVLMFFQCTVRLQTCRGL